MYDNKSVIEVTDVEFSKNQEWVFDMIDEGNLIVIKRDERLYCLHRLNDSILSNELIPECSEDLIIFYRHSNNEIKYSIGYSVNEIIFLQNGDKIHRCNVIKWCRITDIK